MKRGKDDEKIMGPMFPRLHVNDTEKGGPRAPPRNKMALYEQLSIPSQSFNPGVLPLNPSNTSSMAPPSSSSQGTSLERNMLFPSRVSHLTPTNLAEKFHTRQLGGASVKAPLAHLEQRKVRDEDDFMVPVFVNSETDQQHNKTKNGFDGEKLTVPDETNIDSECHGDKTCGSLRWANGDKIDDVSETSMVDSISGLDIFPDDLVGIIGQKHFWKARREIANQQRVFAVQVFELHRLIKVQRLIAGSPHLLLEDTAYLSKPSFKGSPAKKLPPDFIVKPLPHTKHKDDSEKPSHKMECSAENAVARTSVSSVKNGSQPSNYGPFLGNPPPAPVNGECFHQVPGHQWLVPIMSPSEGLIYKPYPGPGFMGCGGCGPFGRTPMTGNFMTSAYGVPASPHQGIGVLPGAPPVVHAHFPPYGMPVMNPAVTGSSVEQMNQFAGPGSHAHSGQLSGGGAKFNIQHQSSCDLPCEKNSAISHVMKFQASTDTELQGSIASSPGERVQRIGASTAAEGKNALPLLPTASNILEGASKPCDTDQRTRVIRVVPHNPRSATESAARIFQSIQKERKQI